MRREFICNADLLTVDEIRRGHMPDTRRYLPLKLFPVFSLQLWETTKVHTSSAVCLKRDSDVLFDHEEIVISAADNCNRLQVSVVAADGGKAGVRHTPGPHTCVCLRCATGRPDLCCFSPRSSPLGSGAHACAGSPPPWSWGRKTAPCRYKTPVHRYSV